MNHQPGDTIPSTELKWRQVFSIGEIFQKYATEIHE